MLTISRHAVVLDIPVQLLTSWPDMNDSNEILFGTRPSFGDSSILVARNFGAGGCGFDCKMESYHWLIRK